MRGISRRRLASGTLCASWTVGGLIAAVAATPARAAGLPNGRVDERVSQQNTDGTATPQATGGFAAIAQDGAVLFGGGATPVGAQPGGENGALLGQRTATGWSVSSFSPTTAPANATWGIMNATSNLSAAVFEAGSPQQLGTTPPAHLVPVQLDYRNAAGQFTTIETDSADPSSPDYTDGSTYGGLSADGQTVVYSSDVAPPGLPGTNGVRTIYTWHPDGTVAALPTGDEDTGTPLPSDCGQEVAGAFDFTAVLPGSTSAASTNNVSSDGSTVFTESGRAAPGCPASQVYAVSGGVATLVSQVTQTGPGAPAQPTPSTEAVADFVGATPDGQTAYFTTTNPLTSTVNSSDTGSNLYEWRAASGGQPAAVTCLSCETTGSANVYPGSVAVSPSGQYVYFEASGVLDGLGTLSGTSTFVYHAGTVQLVGPAGQVAPGAVGSTTPSEFAMNSEGNIVAYYSNGTDDAGTATQPLYEATVTPGGVTTTCLSCLPDGSAETATLQATTTGVIGSFASDGMVLGAGEQTLSADGSEVVFDSAAALAPGAVSGVNQVYLWQRGSGVALIAPEADGDPFTGVISPDGTDLVFSSFAALTADTTQAGTATLYDARVGGGFPAAASAAPCVGDGCQPSNGAAPSTPTIGSTVTTAGNRHARRPRTVARTAIVALTRPSDAAFARLRAGRPLALRVRVRGTGLVRITLTARIHGRTLTLAAGTARAHGRGRSSVRTLAVPLRPDGAAWRRVAVDRHVRVTVRVAFSGARTRTLSFTLTARSAA